MACINTKWGKLQRALAFRSMGVDIYPWHHREPYVTWEELIGAVENSLQLSEPPRIFNGRKESK